MYGGGQSGGGMYGGGGGMMGPYGGGPQGELSLTLHSAWACALAAAHAAGVETHVHSKAICRGIPNLWLYAPLCRPVLPLHILKTACAHVQSIGSGR